MVVGALLLVQLMVRVEKRQYIRSVRVLRFPDHDLVKTVRNCSRYFVGITYPVDSPLLSDRSTDDPNGSTASISPACDLVLKVFPYPPIEVWRLRAGVARSTRPFALVLTLTGIPTKIVNIPQLAR